MKVLDPQAALLTSLEVHHFLESNPPRRPEKKSGAYEPVNLQEYYTVRKDFKRYIDLTSPHVKQYPPPDPFLGRVVQRLRKFDLTKTEVLSIVNLGLGVPRSQDTKVEAGGDEANADDGDAADAVEPNFRALAECVIDSLAERFPGDEGEAKIEAILAVLGQCMREASAA